MNGTFVNGEKIDQPCRIKLGDEIRVGRTTLELLAAAGES